jgi:hypothetical protein
MGMDRLASPDAPLTFVFPETRKPSVTGEPRASITAGCAFARAKASLYTSVDFTALNTIKSTEPTKTTNNTAILKQPRGTNHFQFRFHQLAFGVGGTGGGICSTEPFYFEREAFCNRSLRCDLSLTGSVAARQDAGHEITTLSSNCFRRRFDCIARRLRDYSCIRSSRARRHMDQLARHCLDHQRRRHVSCRQYQA